MSAPTFDWQGITLSVAHSPCWLGTDVMHLQIRVIRPKRSLLPITDTGYRSCFPSAEEVAAAGSPEAFVLAWLDRAARSPTWQRRCFAARQLRLF